MLLWDYNLVIKIEYKCKVQHVLIFEIRVNMWWWIVILWDVKQEWHSKFGGVHGELRKVRVGLRAYVRQQEENHLRKKGEKLSSSARATSGKNTFCHINESFVSGGWMCEGQVTVINEETPRDQPIWVWSCPPEFELGNWQVIKQPGISMANSM